MRGKNIGEVESSYSIYGYGDRRPDGGLPEDYLTQNKVRNRSIDPFAKEDKSVSVIPTLHDIQRFINFPTL